MKKEIKTISHIREARYTFGPYSDNFMGCDLLMTAAVNEDKSMGDVVDVCTGNESLVVNSSYLETFANVLRLFAKDASGLASNAVLPHYKEVKYCIPGVNIEDPEDTIDFRFSLFFPERGIISDHIEVTINSKFIPLSMKYIGDAAEAIENFSRDLTVSN